MKLKRLMTALTFVAAGVATASAVANVDPSIPAYNKTTGVSGNLSSVGSDTLANLMTLWAEDYKKLYPSVNIQIQAAGSSTAPPALTEGTSNLGPMSRAMKDVELSAFESKYGYKPTAIPVAVDALAVFVNKDNPIKGLSMAQVDGDAPVCMLGVQIHILTAGATYNLETRKASAGSLSPVKE